MTGVETSFQTPSARARWDAFVQNEPTGHLMQTCRWGDFKAALGWRVHRIGVMHNGMLVAGAQVLFRSLWRLPVTVAYIPRGPVFSPSDEATAAALLQAIHRVAHRQRAIFLKVEPHFPNTAAIRTLLQNCGFQPSPHTNQPRTTLMLDLSVGEAALWANMRRKTRKLVRRAEREGVRVIAGDGDDLPRFYHILRVTARLKGFPIHAPVFYEQAWRAFEGSDRVRLWLATYRGETVAGKMVFRFGDTSMHLWGGTLPTGRKIFASYRLQWEAIRRAAESGCARCDLWGIPDEIGDMLARGEPVPKEGRDGLWGVYTFKRGFGGEVVSFVGAYDYVYMPAWYWLGMKLTASRTVDTLSHWLERV